jgi:transposase
MGELIMKQRQYDNEFKREAIMLAEKAKEEGRSIASVASNLGISANNLYNWLEKSTKDENGQIVTDSELTALRKELMEVKLERDILKKAVAIFSKQQK